MYGERQWGIVGGKAIESTDLEVDRQPPGCCSLEFRGGWISPLWLKGKLAIEEFRDWFQATSIAVVDGLRSGDTR